MCLFPFENRFYAESQEREQAEEAGYGEGGGGVVFVVKLLDSQGHRVSLPGDMAGDNRNGAEFTHGTGIAKNDTVDETPFDGGQRHVPEGLQTVGSESEGGLLLFCSRGLHDRNQLPGNERKRDEN